MSLLLHQILRTARATFDPLNVSTSVQNYRKLKELVNKLSAADINLPASVLSGRNLFNRNGVPAPCGFVSLLEHPDVSISIFILGDNQVMPLHDHPHMYGLLKAITGNLHVQGFTAVNDEQHTISVANPDRVDCINVRPETPVTINSVSDVIELRPVEGNFHQIAAVNGPAAFFDILSPPYSTVMPIHGARPCTYYRIVNREKYVYLERTECPDTFYSIPVPYDLPEFGPMDNLPSF